MSKTFDYDNGDKYEGAMEGKKRHGQGTYHSGGCSWTGEWKNDTLNGTGVYKDEDGEYKGDFVECSKEGKGEFVWNSGETYVGEFKDDTMQGQGKYTFSNGRVYEGSWTDGQRCGFGVLTLPDGSKYEGEWNEDKCHGKGKWIEPTGVFEGTFVDGKKQGHGVYKYSNGTTFEGDWDGDKKTKGVLKNSKGEFNVEFAPDGRITKQTKVVKEPTPEEKAAAEKAASEKKAAAEAAAAASGSAPVKEGQVETDASAAAASAAANKQEEVDFMVTEMKEPIVPGKALPAGWQGPISTAMLGAEKVGKTALISRFMHDEFSTEYDATVEDSFLIVCEIGVTYVLDIKDLGGDPMFAECRDSAIPGCEAFVFAFSPFDKESWDVLPALRKQVEEEQKKKGKKVPSVLVATKTDNAKKYNRAVSTEQGMALAKEWGVKYFETSSKEDIGIKAAFQALMDVWSSK